jgi:hypothetical protein
VGCEKYAKVKITWVNTILFHASFVW